MRLRGLNWTIGAELGRACLGAGSFLLLARALGTSEFGVIVAVSALVAILTPMSTLGATWLTQSDNTTPLAQRTSAYLTLAAVALVPLSALGGIGVSLALGTAVATGCLLVYGELVCQWFVTTLGSSFLGLGEHRRYFRWTFAASVVRFSAAVVTYAVAPSVATWAVSFAALGTIAVVVAVVATRARLGWRVFKGYFDGPRLRRGMGFSAVGTSTAVVDYADQFLMGSVVSSSTAGLYGFAWKLSAYSLIPVRGICVRAFPEYFRAAEAGDLTRLRGLIRRTGLLGMALGGVSGVTIAFAGWALVRLVLPEFSEAAVLLFVLVVPMALRAWHYTLGDALYSLDAARTRVLCVWGSAAFAIPASLVGMTRWGALGGAVASAVTEVVTVALFAFALGRALRSKADVAQQVS